MPVLPRHVLCFLGGEQSFEDLANAITAEINQTAPEFALDLEFSQAVPDERMSASFGVCWDRVHERAYSSEDEAAVSKHGAVFYVLSPPMEQPRSTEVSARALELVDRVLGRGLLAAKGESAGVAHGVMRWRELAEAV